MKLFVKSLLCLASVLSSWTAVAQMSPSQGTSSWGADPYRSRAAEPASGSRFGNNALGGDSPDALMRAPGASTGQDPRAREDRLRLDDRSPFDIGNPLVDAQDGDGPLRTDPRDPQRRARELPPASQFQRFVQQATGRMLQHYGSELFKAPQPFAADAAMPVPAEYVLAVGDEVRVQVWGSMDYVETHVIDRSGQIRLPKIGMVSLGGVAARDLDKVLRSHVERVFSNVNVTGSLGRLRSIQVYVVGQAQQPGTHRLSGLSTLVNAVFASGGPNPQGSMRNIQLRRGGQTVATLDLYDFIGRGDKGQDMPLRAGDVVVIPPAGPRVAITGALDHAAIYELKPGGSALGDLLALGGGLPTLADPRRAVLERVTPQSLPSRQVQNIALNADGLKQSLQDGDVLTILPISPAFANAVTLQGTVAQPLRYRWFEGMRLLDLIPDREALITPGYYARKNMLVQNLSEKEAVGELSNRVKRLADEINWDYAVVERLDPERLTTRILPFNLGRLVLNKDPQHNMVLQPGDVVTILSDTDVRLPVAKRSRLVRVEGEVAAPGIYQAEPGETLPQLIQRIGGLTPQAYLFGTEFTRELVRKRQQTELDALIRRLESQAQSQQSIQLANATGERAAQAQAVQQAQQAQLRSQIERLRQLKSNGRVSLELDPRLRSLAALPAIPLEDGDRVVVPSSPGFVAAVGSVNNENVFIHRPGKTVGEVLRSAGLTEDAEPDQAFLLRADGSLVARRDRGNWLGSRFESLELMPGDSVVVPAMMDRESRYNFIIRSAKDWTQILANLGLGAAALRTLRN